MRSASGIDRVVRIVGIACATMFAATGGILFTQEDAASMLAPMGDPRLLLGVLFAWAMLALVAVLVRGRGIRLCVVALLTLTRYLPQAVSVFLLSGVRLPFGWVLLWVATLSALYAVVAAAVAGIGIRLRLGHRAWDWVGWVGVLLAAVSPAAWVGHLAVGVPSGVWTDTGWTQWLAMAAALLTGVALWRALKRRRPRRARHGTRLLVLTAGAGAAFALAEGAGFLMWSRITEAAAIALSLQAIGAMLADVLAAVAFLDLMTSDRGVDDSSTDVLTACTRRC